ncbi:MAG: CpcT/CpeT family chromophore lyase [Gammaproteobacteria bacterium]
MLRKTALLITTLVICTTSRAADTPSVASPADQELKELIGLYIGTYLSAPDEGARDARPILLRVVAIDPPAGYSRALYSEMRHDGVGGDIYRQSLLVFDESPERRGNTMTSLAFTDRQAAAELIRDPGLLAAGHLSTAAALAPGCTTHFIREGAGFFGRIDPATCVITGKRGDIRHIESQTLLRRNAIEQLERGYNDKGQLLFGNKDGVRYVWPRIDTADMPKAAAKPQP